TRARPPPRAPGSRAPCGAGPRPGRCDGMTCSSGSAPGWARGPAGAPGPTRTHGHALRGRRRLQRALHLEALEALDLVARLDVVVGPHRDAALGAAADLVDVLLEPPQRFQLALEDHGVVAQHADRLVPLDHALDHHAAGHGAELGAAEHLADLGD